MSSSFLAASAGLDHYIQGWFPFRWAAGDLEICWINFTSTPSHPQKKQIESTNYHYFAKVFVTSHLSCWGVAIRPSPRVYLPKLAPKRDQRPLQAEALRPSCDLDSGTHGSFSSGRKGKPGISISTLWLWLTWPWYRWPIYRWFTWVYLLEMGIFDGYVSHNQMVLVFVGNYGKTHLFLQFSTWCFTGKPTEIHKILLVISRKDEKCTVPFVLGGRGFHWCICVCIYIYISSFFLGVLW